jgi:ribonuclease HI
MKNNYPYYVVWKGRKIGIFDNYEECEMSVKGYPNNGYKGANSLDEAIKLMFNGLGNYLKKDSASGQSIKHKKTTKKLTRQQVRKFCGAGCECKFDALPPF